MMKHIKTVVSLTVICAVVSFLLALTNSITAPIIKERENAAVNEALAEVLPGGEGFEQLDISKYTLPETITEAYKASNGGYVFKMVTAGYGSNFVIMCGVSAEGTVAGAKCISSTETLGVEKVYGEKLKDSSLESIDGVETESGATKTTEAYKNAVKDALNAAVILGGGEVDLRSEEEILNDNLKEALPEGDKFTEVFLTFDAGEISAAYEAENKAGYVFVIGEDFVATDTKGKVISSVSDDVKTTVETSAQKLINETLEKIDITKYADMPSAVEEAYITNGGNYVLYLKAAGYGINGGDQWHPASGEYIKIKVSVTKDGKIIKCVTLSQKESENIGDACAKPEFYGQFNGKTAETYGEIDAISGATITTDGYKSAISKAFDAVKIMEGGAN